MPSRPRRVLLRLAAAAPVPRSGAHRFQARSHRFQAHARRAQPGARALVPVFVALAVGPALVPLGETTRATPPTEWSPQPTAVFRPFGALAGRPAPEGTDSRSTADRTRRPKTLASPPVTARTAAATPAVPAAAADVGVAEERPPEGPTHVVQAGDNLWTIARRHRAELAAILRWNDGVEPDRLVAGQRLLVPGGAAMTPLARPKPAAQRPASARPAPTRMAAAPRTGRSHLWPLPMRGTLTRGFSAAHPAIDIAAPRGTRVRAIADGTVVWAGWRNNGGGYVVILEHPDGMTSEYNHNSRLTVAKGDRVAQGETIALVGATGNSTGPHLDLRIEMGGRLVDPLDVY